MSHKILHSPASYSLSAKQYLIFFITGNPGLIGYYTTFLGTLNYLLCPDRSKADLHGPVFHIYGQSLAGFEDDDTSTNSNKGRSIPYSLEEQIDLTFQALKSQRISNGARKGEGYDGIILMGHSVGSYILLEIVRRARLESSSINTMIEAGILLFPTVTHIAQSSSGVKISTLFRLRDFPFMASRLTKGLFWLLSRTALRRLVAIVTGMPDDAADVTAGFLISERGVWQAL
jgi:hypothetical protein